jgi:hypothetical protein
VRYVPEESLFPLAMLSGSKSLKGAQRRAAVLARGLLREFLNDVAGVTSAD